MQRNSFLSFLIFGLILISACSEEDEQPSTVDCNESGLSASTSGITEATCSEGGSVTINVTGGEAPYEYSLDEVTFSSSNTFTDRSAGTYTATVVDNNNCETTTSFTIATAEGVVSLESFVQDELAGCGTNLGQITITASGGVGILTYSADGDNFTEDNVLTGLFSGAQSIHVRDEEGCELRQDVLVNSGVRYSGTADGQSESVGDIIANNCAISGCHVAGTGLPNWTNFSNVQANAQAIKSRTANGTMPPGTDGSISQEQIDLIACWVNDGANNN